VSEQKKVEDILANLDRLLAEGVEEESGNEGARPVDQVPGDPADFQSARAVNVEVSSPDPQEPIDGVAPQLDNETEDEKPRLRILLTREMLVEEQAQIARDGNNVTD